MSRKLISLALLSSVHIDIGGANKNLAISFKLEEIGLSYCTCVNLVTLTLKFDLPGTLKNFNLGCYLLIVAAR